MPREQVGRTSQAVNAIESGLFDTERPGGLHERVYKSLVHAIISGRFAKGNKLPSEADLAITFTVSRPVVRQALEKLRTEGVIESLRGSGNYVAGLDHLVDDMHEFGIDWSKHAKSMLDDLEFRLIVEPEAAYFAARRRTRTDLNRMRAALDQFEEAHSAGRITHHFDYLFHEAIALATTNGRFIDAARAVEFPKDAQSLLIRHLVYFHPLPRGTEFIREHLRVFELIERREPDAARKAMRNHIDASRNRLNEQLELLRSGRLTEPSSPGGGKGKQNIERNVIYFAHSGTLDDKSDWQTLPEHSSNVGELTAAFAGLLGLEKAGRVLGTFHDLGKYDPRFQQRLEGADISVNHSTAGAVILHERTEGDDHFISDMLVYAILGHHAGLPDKRNEFGHCVKRRVEEHRDMLDPIWEAQIPYDLTDLLPQQLAARIGQRRDMKQRWFDLSVVTRFLFSCLVDADFKDTERFYARLEGWQVDRDWAALQDLLPDFTARFNAYMAAKPADSALNRLRGDILAHVREGAAMGPGLFTLTVPTGGGKTLATLGFALDHARLHGHQRIIYAIPFTSIVDQTADIFRSVLGGEHILEHHSAIDEEHPDKKKQPTSRDRLKLAMEDWAAPVIVTTNVQLFESLFAARTSRARKVHNIAKSIIILDEAQTIPRPLLKPCVRMLDALALQLGCTIILCTATQPALGAPEFPDGLALAGRELAPDPHGLARKLRRARIERVGAMDNPALVAAIAEQTQALVIVNSRKHALELYREAKAAGLDGLVHLTTRQCAADRRQILARVRQLLKEGKPCRVIATSLIEAGVDIDFPQVWRAEAGLDSIVQAAGRCNREGRNRWEDSVVRVFSAPDYLPPQEIKGLIGAMERMEGDHEDLLTLDAIEHYFREVYWGAGKDLDVKKILDDFRVEEKDGKTETNFAFRTVSEKFRMIESKMVPVIIEWDARATKAVHEIGIETIPAGKIARDLQSYIVQIPPRARDLLQKNGHAAFEREDLRGNQFVVLKNTSLYTTDAGLLWEDAEYLAIESGIL